MGQDTGTVSEAVFHILLSLMDEPRHGYAILLEVEERTGGAVVLGSGTLYSALKRMRAAGWVEETPDPDPEDPRRRVYRLAPAGRDVVRAESLRLEALLRQARAKAALAGGGEEAL